MVLGFDDAVCCGAFAGDVTVLVGGREDVSIVRRGLQRGEGNLGIDSYRSTSSPLSFSMVNLLVRLERYLETWRSCDVIEAQRFLPEGERLSATSLKP